MRTARLHRRALLALLASSAAGVHAVDAQAWHGREPPLDVGGTLEGVDQHGKRFGLQRVAGAPALLFFGFTHCGSTCPLALATARELLHATDRSRDAAIVFVTLDPLSDGPEQLRSFLAPIHPRLIGLTGTPQQILAAAERYGVALRNVAASVEHSSMWYLLDAASRVRRVYPHTTPASDLLADIRRLHAEQG